MKQLEGFGGTYRCDGLASAAMQAWVREHVPVVDSRGVDGQLVWLIAKPEVCLTYDQAERTLRIGVWADAEMDAAVAWATIQRFAGQIAWDCGTALRLHWMEHYRWDKSVDGYRCLYNGPTNGRKRT